jgi:hypothetical protein
MATAVESEPAKRNDESWSKSSVSDNRLEGSLDKLDLTVREFMRISEKERDTTYSED